MIHIRFLTVASSVVATLLLSPARAGHLVTLHAFTGGSDGGNSSASLLYQDGALFGTTSAGGTYNQGTVFKFDPTTGAETILHSFGAAGDGQGPSAAVICENGLLYGTTFIGGTGHGTLFSTDPVTGSTEIVYDFGGDSWYPLAAPLYENGALYGTTRLGSRYAGSVWKWSANAGVEKTYHKFKGKVNGTYPVAALIYQAGTFYGTAYWGGQSACLTQDTKVGCGVVFKIDAATKAYTVLHNFQGGADGAWPEANVIFENGMLYGTTSSGGSGGKGVVFSVDPASGMEKIIYAFKSADDGSTPESALLYHNGALYGTTSGSTFLCGKIDCQGVLFKVNIDSGKERILYGFTGGADGGTPLAALIYSQGTFYGTTAFGGNSGCTGINVGCGTIFSFSTK